MAILLIDAEKYVINLLNNKLATNYVYHNLAHTQKVVKRTIELAEKLEVDKVSLENLQLAALFHDTGFIKKAENHEQESVIVLTHFLQEKNIEAKRIEAIANLILATKIGREPSNDLEKIMTDADCAHIGNKSFEDKTALLRKEWEVTENKNYSDAEWFAININFLTNEHKYHTDYALKNWSKGKEKNLAKLLKNKNKLEEDLKKFKQKKEALDVKKNKSDVPERGVETMFRVALKNHMTLSNIADTKANILLSVT